MEWFGDRTTSESAVSSVVFAVLLALFIWATAGEPLGVAEVLEIVASSGLLIASLVSLIANLSDRSRPDRRRD